MTANSDTGSAAQSLEELPPAAQVLALSAKIAELERENNRLRVDLESAIAREADAEALRGKYEALRSSTLGRVTSRYWDVRARLRRDR